MRRYTVLLAPRLASDVQQHVARLIKLEETGQIAPGYHETWYGLFEDALTGLGTLAARHPFAPERQAWGRDVRNALFAEYRILYLVMDGHVWAMRVRHQRQAQLRKPGPGTGYVPPP